MRRLIPLLIAALASTAWPGSLPAAAEGADKARKAEYRGAMETEYPDWFKLSFLDLAEDVAEARAAGKRLIVLFTQKGCPYCNALVERNLSQKDIEDFLRQNFDVVALDMWGDREVTGLDGTAYTEKAFAAALKVQFTPTLLFFDEEGRIILRLNGYVPPRRFRLALEWAADHRPGQPGFREFLARRAPPAGSGELIREPFFLPPPVDLRPRGRPIAVFFEQRDCPACETLHRKVLPDARLRELLSGFTVAQLDMWSRDPVTTPGGERLSAREWADRLDIRYAPTIVLFAADGTEVIRGEAFFKLFHIRGMFEYVARGAWREQPSFQRFLSALAEEEIEHGRDVDIWSYARDRPEAETAP